MAAHAVSKAGGSARFITNKSVGVRGGCLPSFASVVGSREEGGELEICDVRCDAAVLARVCRTG